MASVQAEVSERHIYIKIDFHQMRSGGLYEYVCLRVATNVIILGKESGTWVTVVRPMLAVNFKLPARLYPELLCWYGD